MRARTLGGTLAATALMAAGCGSSTDSGGGVYSTVEEGALTVCSDVPYPPFEEFAKGNALGFKGFDVEIMQQVAKGLKLDLTIKDVAFEGLQSGLELNSGSCDIGASAMTITKEREQNLDFSDPYYDSKQSLLVPVDSDINSVDDLSGPEVGVQAGTTGKAFAMQKLPESPESFPSDGELYTAIKAGTIEAVMQDLPVNLDHTEGGQFKVVQTFDTGEHYGFAVKEEGSEELLKAVNEQLKKMRSDGTYDQIYKKYFSTS